MERQIRLNNLFPNENPWHEQVTELQPVAESERIERAVFDVLREMSQLKLISELHDQPLGETAERFSSRRQLIEQHGGETQIPQVSVDDFSFPISDVKRTESGEVVTRDVLLQQYEGEEGYENASVETDRRDAKLFALDIPQPAQRIRPGGPENSGADGNVILVDVDAKQAWDFWQAATLLESGKNGTGGVPGNSIVAAGSVANYRIDGAGARMPGESSSGGRASGLPYLGGLIIPEDLANGTESVISHALAFGLPRLRYFRSLNESDPPNHRFPAHDTEKTAFVANPYALAAGERIRLKPFDQIQGMRFVDGENRLDRVTLIEPEAMAPITRIILTALQTYGAYLVDGAGGFGFAAEDFRTAPVTLTEDQVSELIADDFPNPRYPDETKWQAIFHTLNDQLGCYLFGADTDIKAGLPFAAGRILDAPPNKDSFHCNFEVVPSPSEPN